MTLADTLAISELLSTALAVSLIQLILVSAYLAVRTLCVRKRPATDTAGTTQSGGATQTPIAQQDRSGLTHAQAIDALRAAEAKYRGIFENAVEGIFQTSADGRYLSVNPALARIYGYETPEQLIDSVADIERQLYVDSERRRQFVSLMDAHGLVSSFESQIYRYDGSMIWISESARAVRDAEGRIDYYEGTVEDITERKQSEELTREKEAAQAASRAKSQFLAHMSHELRTPLNGVIGMLDLLLEASDSPQSKRYASVARSSADLLLNVINQVLDFSKIEAGKMELAHVDFDLRLMLEETLDMFAPKAAQKSLELALSTPRNLPECVRGDAHRFQQVLVNLIGNALKFTERGQVLVRVTVSRESAEQFRIRIDVEDTGAGIPPERISRLFQSFTQVDASTTRQFGGTGLGLAISKQLVELMGGTIGVESQPLRGSTFWFVVPLAKSGAESSRPAVVTQDLKGLRALVVDDNAVNREILFRQLSAWQMPVETATNGLGAWELLERANQEGRGFELAIIDCHMPTMDGAELSRRIAADVRFSTMRVLMLSSVSAGVDSSHHQQTPVAGYLSKPVRQGELLNAITALSSGDARPQHAGRCALAEVAASRGGGTRRARVLLADDNEVNCAVALEILNLSGFACDVVSTGRQAIQSVIQQRYDAVLMDCQMPEIDGLTATREIRRLEASGCLKQRGYRLPIVALTANAVDGDRQLCEAAGMDDYLTKPFDSATLVRLLQTMISTMNDDAVRGAAPEPTPVEPNMRGATDSPLDLDELAHRCLQNVALMERLLTKFTERLPHQIDELTRLVERDELAAAATQAHSLKGSAGNMSARGLQKLLADLECASAGARGPAARQLTSDLAQESKRCIEFVTRRSSFTTTASEVQA